MLSLAIVTWGIATALSIAGIGLNAWLMVRLMRANREADDILARLQVAQERAELFIREEVENHNARINLACALCGEPLNGHASYLCVMMPLDERWGLGTGSAVCVKCGEVDRAEVLRRVEYAALLMFGPEGGHA